MTNPTIPRTHYDRLDQRRLWLTNRIEAKEKTGWETTYDESERDALAAALAVLEPADDKPEVDPGDGYRLLDVGELIKHGDEITYSHGVNGDWKKTVLVGDKVEDRVFRRRIDTAPDPDPGEGWRIADGEDCCDERCEVWDGGEWYRRDEFSGCEFREGYHYRVPIDPAPKHPPVPEGWRLIDKEKDYPKRADDKFWNRTSGTWAAVAYDLEFEPTDIYIRRIEPTYRPFASAEEFDSLSHKIVVNKGTTTRRRIDHWNEMFVNGMHWEMAFRKYTFLDGTPFGVEVKE